MLSFDRAVGSGFIDGLFSGRFGCVLPLLGFVFVIGCVLF